MRDPNHPAGNPAEVAQVIAARPDNGRVLYVINLSSSTNPMPLEMPDVRSFFGLAVFRSRRTEDGRDRYRLHLGYFESRADAERALPAVQRRYPTAWIAVAPRSGLGSLDDTNVSEFRLIHSPAHRAPPVSAATKIDARAGTIPIAAPQRYVVQLVWSDRRVDPNQIPRLAIYDAYTLYTVTVMRGGERLYGIRLGFFTSVISARQIALYVRPDFPGVAVVPVSSREYDVARTIAWHCEARAIAGAEARPAVATSETSRTAAAKPEPSLTPTPTPSVNTLSIAPAGSEQPSAPNTIAVAGQPAQTIMPTTITVPSAEPELAKPAEPVRVVSAKLVHSTPPMTEPILEAKAAAKPGCVVVSERRVQAPRRRPAAGVRSATMAMGEESRRRRSAFTREELLAALGANELTLPADRRDPRTEPGMRYPGVNVPKRESALVRFLHRLANRLS